MLCSPEWGVSCRGSRTDDLRDCRGSGWPGRLAERSASVPARLVGPMRSSGVARSAERDTVVLGAVPPSALVAVSHRGQVLDVLDLSQVDRTKAGRGGLRVKKFRTPWPEASWEDTRRQRESDRHKMRGRGHTHRLTVFRACGLLHTLVPGGPEEKER